MDPITDIGIFGFSLGEFMEYLGGLIFGSSEVASITESGISSYEVITKELLGNEGVEAVTNLIKEVPEEIPYTPETSNISNVEIEIPNKDLILQLYNNVDPSLPREDFLKQVSILAERLEGKGLPITNNKGYTLLKSIVDGVLKYKKEILAAGGVVSGITSIPIVKKQLEKFEEKIDPEKKKPGIVPINEINRYFFY